MHQADFLSFCKDFKIKVVDENILSLPKQKIESNDLIENKINDIIDEYRKNKIGIIQS